MPHTYDWLDDIPFWEPMAGGRESRVFALEDFLARSNRRGDQAWYAHFKRWCGATDQRRCDYYHARSIGAVCGVEMLIVMRERASAVLN